MQPSGEKRRLELEFTKAVAAKVEDRIGFPLKQIKADQEQAFQDMQYARRGACGVASICNGFGPRIQRSAVMYAESDGRPGYTIQVAHTDGTMACVYLQRNGDG